MATWTATIVLIALAAIHIGEETLAGFRGFLNTKWFDGTEDCPVSRLKGVVVDKIGLFLGIAVFALAGALFDGRWILVALGIVTTDIVQHAIFSAAKRGYTPGVATSALYLASVVWFFAQPQLRGLVDGPLAWVALAAGAAVIMGNYLLAQRKVRRGDCQPAPA
ncbi:MAG: HXXEE domain-containing protein [Propylenella sp.]